jgi:hypothetical protein
MSKIKDALTYKFLSLTWKHFARYAKWTIMQGTLEKRFLIHSVTLKKQSRVLRNCDQAKLTETIHPAEFCRVIKVGFVLSS